MPVNDATLTDYALGLLAPAARRQLEHQLADSPALRRRLGELQQTLAAPPVNPGPALLQRVLGTTRPASRFEGLVQRLGVFLDLSQTRVRELLATVDTGTGWQDTGIAGVRTLALPGGPKRAQARCTLLYLQAGAAFPPHRHRGDEWSLVLQGQARENGGGEFSSGDIIHKPAGSSHGFRVQGSEACLLAVVLYGGLEWLESDP